jgi:hypothetical protein
VYVKKRRSPPRMPFLNSSKKSDALLSTPPRLARACVAYSALRACAAWGVRVSAGRARSRAPGG